jgi:lipoprotein NlpD
MSKSFRKYFIYASKVVSIMTILFFLMNCSSQPAANVEESVTQTKSNNKIHLVVAGETLYSIAWRYGVDYRELAYFNGIKPPFRIHPTQKILIDITAQKKSPVARTSSGFESIKPPISSNAGAVFKKNTGEKATEKPKFRSEKKSIVVPLTPKNSTVSSSLKWQWPATGKLLAPFQGDTTLNKGIDLNGKLGESVVAAAGGQVVYSGSGLRGYGKLLIIKHNEIFLSAYAHNSELLIKEGDVVKVGQRIADMGSSGTNRVKLHFEIRREGKPVNPLLYLPKRN